MSASKPSDIAQQIKYIASVLRALVTSRKQPCTVREVLQEYPEVEGEPLNYTKLGFRSVEDLLRETDEFVLSRLGGETCIAAKYSKNSSHIAMLVRGQKSSSCKSNKTKKKAQARLPQRPTYQNWNKNSYSSYGYGYGYQKAYPPASRYIVPHSNYNNYYNNNNNYFNNNNNYNNNNNNTNQMYNRNAQPYKQVVNPYNREQLQQPKSSVNPYNREQLQQPKASGYKDLHEGPNAKKDNNVLHSDKPVQQQQNLRQTAPAPIQKPKASEGLNAKKDTSVLQNVKPVQQQQDLRQSVPAQIQEPIAGGFKDLREKLNAKKDNDVSNNVKPAQQQQDLRQKLEASKKQSQIIYQPPHQQGTNQQVVVQASNQQKKNRTHQRSQFHNMRASTPGANSVQDRLKITITNDHFKPNNGVSPEPSDLNSSNPFNDRKNVIKKEIIQQIISPKVFHFNPKLDPVTSLFQYCVARRCHQPEYSFFRSKSNLVQCRILINGSIYSTYPKEYPSEDTAKVACAALTIEEIKAQECRRQLPVCPESDAELRMKIYQELKSHPHGIFAKNFSEWFESTFEQLLPDHWWSLIEGSEHFITETTPGDNVIIFSNNELEESQESDSESSKIEAITLPWADKYWNLYIRHCESTDEIWARLFGEEYSERYDNLMNDLDVYMMTHKIRPVSLECKQIYIVCLSDCWHRVRLVDQKNGLGRCFFIDYGDEDWVPLSKLYICENKFLKLAPQAIAFSLFGMEDFAGNPNAKRHLDEMLASRSLVGEIITKEDVYRAGNADRIQIVLYDTSTHEDVNLNSLILHQICDDTPPPEIKSVGLTNVQVAHITDQGDVFLQVENSELQFVRNLIHQLIETQFKEDQHKVTRTEVQRSTMYLISDKSTNQWYRGVLANATHRRDSEEFDVFYVDHGMMKKTHISSIFHLESLSTALSKYPRQAIKAKLDNIPPITPGIVARIRGLLPVDSKALVKISTPGDVPLIVVYKRFVGSEALCNVNEAIRIEQELECLTSCDNIPTPPAEDNNKELQFLGVSLHNSSTDMNQTFVDLTVPNGAQKSDHHMTKLKDYEDVPTEGKYFDVRVAMSANPSNFIVQPYKHFAELQKLMKDLQDYCENKDESIPAGDVKIGQAYAGKNKDGFYHRVTVVDVIQGMIHVNFCDFGDIDIIRTDQLKSLPVKFRKLPKQAIQAKLHGITASSVDWEDCLRFRNLTIGKTFVSVIKKITKGNQRISPDTRIIELDLIDVQSGKDVYIRDILFRKKTSPLRHTANK